MEKRKLSAVQRENATEDMFEIAGRLGGMRHIVTAKLLEDKKILLLNFYEIAVLNKGKPEAAFRTFLSHDDYITQDLKVSKVKWLTASFYNMDSFRISESHYNQKTKDYDRTDLIFIRSNEEKSIIEEFFKDFKSTGKCTWATYPEPWESIKRFQEKVQEHRLAAKHKKETDAIDTVMTPVKEAPKEFYDWVWETGMSFSRYLIYKESKKGKAECECTYCKKKGIVDRATIRLRNNEKGNCPFCGSKVTFKARGKLAAQNRDERWFVYVDSTPEGFIFRYFHAVRNLRNESFREGLIDKRQIDQYIHELSRAFYRFDNGDPKCTSYEWGVYKQRGPSRWCPDQGKIACMECILYPGNLPDAWKHTPMKYSALEQLSTNIPTKSVRYEDGIRKYLKFPKLEWLCKMGLNNIATYIISGNSGSVGKINFNGETIYEILGLTKINTKILQEIDGNTYHLRLLQVSQQIGLQFKAEQLKEYYEVFECNTDLLKHANGKVSLHKLVKYILKESENYPIGEKGGCWMYSYNRYKEREDPRIERKRNMAHDWLEYLEWCRALKYNTDNMFIYMPNNFKKVHDRTAKEYQALQDKKAAAEKRRRELEAKRKMEQTKKALEEILNKSKGMDAFSITGKGLILVVPKTADEIKAEGEALHHCVGGYVERVASGKTSIFFIRKANAPDKSYFTMEWRDNQIIQCRGLRNCGMTPEVEAFTKAFEKKMLETNKQTKGTDRRRCG